MEEKQFHGLPTYSTMNLLLFLYDHGTCTFRTQDVLKDEKYFYYIMDILVRWKKVDREDGHNMITRKSTPSFKINLAGRMWVERNIFEYRSCIRC